MVHMWMRHTTPHCNTLPICTQRIPYNGTCVCIKINLCVWKDIFLCMRRWALMTNFTATQSLEHAEHTATHCNTLQHTATHCNTLQHTAPHCSTLQHASTQQVGADVKFHCNTVIVTLHLTAALATHCNTLQHATTETWEQTTHSTSTQWLQHTATHCNALQHNRWERTTNSTAPTLRRGPRGVLWTGALLLHSVAGALLLHSVAERHEVRMIRGTHINESCHTYEWVMSHIWMSHVTHMNESCHTYEWVMSHI